MGTHEIKRYELESVECATGAEMVIAIQPTSWFKCDNMIFEPATPGFLLTDVMVGSIPQFRNPMNKDAKMTPISVEVFAPPKEGEVPTAFSFDTCHPSLLFKVTVKNEGKESGKIKLTLVGRQIEYVD